MPSTTPEDGMSYHLLGTEHRVFVPRHSVFEQRKGRMMMETPAVMDDAGQQMSVRGPHHHHFAVDRMAMHDQMGRIANHVLVHVHIHPI
jgi:hypothetical protein